MILVGKASPSPKGEIEYFLTDFRKMLDDRDRFVYAWTFNPDQGALVELRNSLPTWLYLAGDKKHSRIRMRISDFYHNGSTKGCLCPNKWQQFCIKGLKNKRTFQSKAGNPKVTHLWLLIDSIEDIDVDLEGYKPYFPHKYARWGRNHFAFLREVTPP